MVNARKNMARNAFIQGKAAECRKAGAVVFEIDESRRGGLTPAEVIEALCRHNIVAQAWSIPGSSIWRITAAEERKAA